MGRGDVEEFALGVPRPRADVPAPRTDDPAPRADDPAPRADDPAPRVDDPAPRADDSTPRAAFDDPRATLTALLVASSPPCGCLRPFLGGDMRIISVEEAVLHL